MTNLLFKRIFMRSSLRKLTLIAFVFLLVGAVWAAPAYKDGSYRATVAENGLGTLSVLVTVKGGLITAVEFPEGKGDIDMEDAALAEYIVALKAAPVLMEVDAVSGATASCNLLKAAIAAALKAAH